MKKYRPIIAAALALTFYTFADILIWQRIFETNQMVQYADIYHTGWFVSLAGYAILGLGLDVGGLEGLCVLPDFPVCGRILGPGRYTLLPAGWKTHARHAAVAGCKSHDPSCLTGRCHWVCFALAESAGRSLPRALPVAKKNTTIFELAVFSHNLYFTNVERISASLSRFVIC